MSAGTKLTLVWTAVAGSVIGVIVLALAYPLSAWNDVCTSVTLLALGSLLVSGITAPRGRKRSLLITAQFFGATYFIVTFSGFLCAPIWNRLPTSHALAWSFSKLYATDDLFVENAFSNIYISGTLSPNVLSGTKEAPAIPIWPKSTDL